MWNIKRNAKKFGYDASFFTHNILWFFLGVFLFARLFYVIGQWNNMRFITEPFQFFVTSDYSFSLFWAIFGFILVLILLLRKKDATTFNKYIDGAVVSFLFVLIIGYAGALLWWQVYGRETSFGIELTYRNPDSPVPSQLPIFPLPIFYGIVSFLIFCWVYILSLFIHIPGYIWYLGMLLFSAMILIGETWSGKQDILSVDHAFNLPQVFAFALAIWSWWRFMQLFREQPKQAHIEE